MIVIEPTMRIITNIAFAHLGIIGVKSIVTIFANPSSDLK